MYHRGQRCSAWAVLYVQHEGGCMCFENKVLCSRKAVVPLMEAFPAGQHFDLCFFLVFIDRQGINKQIFFLNFTERIFIQTRRFWRFCNQPIEAFVILCRELREFFS